MNAAKRAPPTGGVGTRPQQMWRYHDPEWGGPVHDDRRHFEFLILEGAQAGLSWSTILNKRDGYRRAFADFDAEKVARFTPREIAKLLNDPGIVRNRLKVESRGDERAGVPRSCRTSSAGSTTSSGASSTAGRT